MCDLEDKEILTEESVLEYIVEYGYQFDTEILEALLESKKNNEGNNSVDARPISVPSEPKWSCKLSTELSNLKKSLSSFSSVVDCDRLLDVMMKCCNILNEILIDIECGNSSEYRDLRWTISEYSNKVLESYLQDENFMGKLNYMCKSVLIDVKTDLDKLYKFIV